MADLVLYRHFDQDDVLLYVGISITGVYRQRQHRDKTPWFNNIAKITLERGFDSIRELQIAENKAIVAENPKYNIRKRQKLIYVSYRNKALGHREVKYRDIQLDKLKSMQDSLSNVLNSEIFKNYPDLCTKINWSVKDGKAKERQFERLGLFFNIVKKGHSIQLFRKNINIEELLLSKEISIRCVT